MKAAIALLVLAVAAATPKPEYFLYQRTLKNLPAQAAQTCVAVEPQVFAHAEEGLADLRLYARSQQGADVETPYIVRSVVATQPSPQPIALLNKGTQHGQTVFDTNLPEGLYSDLVLDLEAQNFIATVHVSGSSDKPGAETEIGSYSIFDLTNQRLGRSTVLHLPESNFAHLHFRIDGPLTPDKINSLSVSTVPGKEPSFQTILESRSVTSKPRATLIEFEVPAHTPVDHIAFNPGIKPALFNREVNVMVTPQATKDERAENRYQPQLASYFGTLLRIHTQQNGHRIDEERLAIDTPGSEFNTPTRWSVTIQNGDDPAIALNSVRVEMLEHDLCFESATNATYTVYYGDPALTSPSYDYAKLFMPQPNAAIAQVTPEQRNASYQPRPDDRPFTEKHPGLLWAGLIAVIAILAAIAIRSVKSTAPA